MAKLKTFHTLTGGQDSDTSRDYFKEDRLRKVVNMELVQEENAIRLQTMRSSLNVLEFIPQPSPNLNVLCALPVQAAFELGSPTNLQERECILLFTTDDNNGDQIILIEIESDTIYYLYPNADDNSPLDFPKEGTISASFTKENGVPEVYWDDNKNELRKVVLRITNNAGNWANITKRSMSVRRRLGVIATTTHSIQVGGSLQGGTYQLFARLYNTTDGTRSKWSLGSNPIPIADAFENNTVGRVFDRKIVFRLDSLTSEIPYYDSIQLAVVKNVDGLAVPSTVAYITVPDKVNYTNKANGSVNLEYTGDTGNERQVPLENIVGDDAGIEYAKTQAIKDNRLWRGNIKYFEYVNDRGTAQVGSASTLKQNVSYLLPIETHNRKGHWRDEVYAYGLGYLDDFGNVGLVEPLDLSNFYKYASDGSAPRIVTGVVAQNAPFQQYTVSLNTTGINVWDYFEIGGVLVTVVEVSVGSMLVKGDLSAVTTPTIAQKLIGKDGNHTDNWAWKYPKRETPTYSILDANNLPQAIGLRLQNVINYPSWAKAVIVVRQKRKKDILFQTPHIPTIGVRGVPTPPFPVLENSTSTLDKSELFNYRIVSDPDYLNEHDTLLPKMFGMGMAKNVSVAWLLQQLLSTRVQWENYYRTQDYSVNEWFGNEIPNYFVAPYPSWVYNFNGEPTVQYNLNGGQYAEACDAIILTRQKLDDQSPFIDIANNHFSGQYHSYYTSLGYVLNGLNKIYLYGLSQIDSNSSRLTITGQGLLVLGQNSFLLPLLPFGSSIFNEVKRFGDLFELSNKQGRADKVPSLTRSFFNQYEVQRAVLLSTENKLIDFTKHLWVDRSAGFNYFPLYPNPIPQEIYETNHLEDIVGLTPSINNIDANIALNVPVKTIFTDENEASGGAWILNIKEGLSDDRYSKTSTDWFWTGAYAKTENNTNAPLSFNVWGGDCFLTLDAIKVNQNTARISDKFNSIGGGIGSTDNVKAGSFVNNVEFLTLWLESEVNTYFGNRRDEYPLDSSLGVQNYSKPYLKQYNGSYSINNELKAYVSDEILTQNQRKQLFPARYVYSDVRIYQATDSAFFDTDGFSVFQPLSRRDLAEEHGGITGIVDLDDPTLMFIQERKVRVEPIGRDLIERGQGAELILTDGGTTGRGGYYLPYEAGCQHMRTIAVYNGFCMFADQINKRVIAMTARGNNFKFISDDAQITYFNTLLQPDFKEKDLFAFIDASNLKQHYWLVALGVGGSQGNIYNLKTSTWESQISMRTFLAGCTVENVLYAFTKDMWRMYKGIGYNFFFGSSVPSRFSIIASPANAAYTTVFDSIVLNKEGTLLANADSCIVSAYDKVLDGPLSEDVLAVTSYLYPTPIAPKNNRWWINRIRFDGKRARATSYVVEVVIRNGERFAVYNVECNFTASFRN